MFETLTDKLQDVFDQLGRRGKLTEEDVDRAMREVRLALLEADVNLKVAKDFIKRVKARAIGAEVTRSLTPAQQVIKIVHEELITTLGEPGRLNLGGASPRVIMLVGLQGSGKTTTAAKLALHLRRQGKRPFMIAADTYRPAAVDQLVTLAKQINVPYWEEGTAVSPPDICQHGLAEARKQDASVVLIDTAGRLQIDDDMMQELQAIKALTSPAEVLLVADAMTGQEAVRIAEGFNEKVNVTGLILTKVDGDARGGAAISMREVTGVPIKFLATGEKLDALEVFHPDRVAGRILGMGDVVSLVEKVAETVEVEQAEKLAAKLTKGEMDLNDLAEQLRQLRKMGGVSGLMGLLPGVAKIKNQMAQANIDESVVKRQEAIIQSMTPTERRRPQIIQASRKRRIAAGSGTSVPDVNKLLKQFMTMNKMMKKVGKLGKKGMMRGGFPPMPGMPGMPPRF